MTPDENSNSRSTFYNMYSENCKSKTDWKWWSHWKHVANLNESLQILWDYPWTQDVILLVSHLLDLYFHWKSFLCIYTNFSQRNRSSRQWNLFTHNIIFTDKRDFSSSVSRQFHGHFLLFLDSLEFWFLFVTILFQYGLFLSDFSSFWHHVVREIHVESQGPEEFCVNKWITYLKSHLEKCLYLSLSAIN